MSKSPALGAGPSCRIAAARAGDHAAIAELTAAVLPHLERVARVRLGSLRARYRASDVVQSSVLEALSSLHTFRGNDDREFAHWLVRMLENNIRDRKRFVQRQRRSTAREATASNLDVLAAPLRTPSAEASERDELVRVAAAMACLPRDQQQVLHLVVLRGLPHEEAAARMNRSAEASRALLARARAALAVRLSRCAGANDERSDSG
jgi:RNA polymerase sigma-70 factor (ECF subfamily)